MGGLENPLETMGVITEIVCQVKCQNKIIKFQIL